MDALPVFFKAGKPDAVKTLEHRAPGFRQESLLSGHPAASGAHTRIRAEKKHWLFFVYAVTASPFSQTGQELIGDGAAGISQAGGGDLFPAVPADQGGDIPGPGVGKGGYIHQ